MFWLFKINNEMFLPKKLLNGKTEKRSSEINSIENAKISEPRYVNLKEKKEEEKKLKKTSNVNKGQEKRPSNDCPSVEPNHADLSGKYSDDEETKYQQILTEAGKEMKSDNIKHVEGHPDKRDNDFSIVEISFEKSGEELKTAQPQNGDTCGTKKYENDSQNEDGDFSETSFFGEYLEGILLREIHTEVNDFSALTGFLGKDKKNEKDKAEARLAARRQARAEAREIRLRELERQQKESDENADKVFDMSLASENILRAGRVIPLSGLINAKDRPSVAINSYHSSRRSSEDSLEDGSYSLRDIKHELKELDEKFRKAMIANAQLDNEKSELTYQVELLKDKLEDLEESYAQLSRECREKNREHEQLKRIVIMLREELSFYKNHLEERDKLISEYGLVIVGGETDEEEGTSERVLVSKQTADLLEQAGDGSLDVRLKKLSDERNELLDQVRHLKLELEEERNRKRSDNKSGCGSLTNGPLDEEANKLISDYRFKLQKAEQDVSTLQANVARLESQVIRYKSAAESSEKAEDELKIEKRKLQRENRESIARIEELETANSHLMRRMDKLKNAKSTLLKEL